MKALGFHMEGVVSNSTIFIVHVPTPFVQKSNSSLKMISRWKLGSGCQLLYSSLRPVVGVFSFWVSWMLYGCCQQIKACCSLQKTEFLWVKRNTSDFSTYSYGQRRCFHRHASIGWSCTESPHFEYSVLWNDYGYRKMSSVSRILLKQYTISLFVRVQIKLQTRWPLLAA